MRLFFDTNVVLDVFAHRQPFYGASAQVWAAAEKRKADGLISTVSITTLCYLVRRMRSRAEAEEMLRAVRQCVGFASCDAAVIDRPIDAGWNDFEDAVQYFSAVAAAADVFVTRDAGRFPAGDLPVMTPAAVLGSHSLK